MDDGARRRVDVPARPRRGPFDRRLGYTVGHNAAGTWLMVGTGFEQGHGETEDCVVAGPKGEIRWLPDLPRAASLWLGDKLVRWSYKDGSPVEYDPVADRFSPAHVAAMRLGDNGLIPRVEVTGRFDWLG